MARPAWNRLTGTLVPDGGKIAAARFFLKTPLSQKELALKAKVSEKTVQNAEANKSIKASFLNKIATALEIDFLEILSEEAQVQLKRPTPTKQFTTNSTRFALPEAIADNDP